MAFDIYKAVTDRILAMLDKGTVPWRHPIHTTGGDGRPRNLETGKAYRGVNVFMLAITAWANGFDSNYWLTFRQAQAQGGHVKKGEKSSMVVFWKQHETIDQKTQQPVKLPVLRYYNVFNAAQVADIKAPDAPPEPLQPFDPIADAEKIIDNYPDPPQISINGKQAFYRPSDDTVCIPRPERFLGREFYYATMFHELVHATGHAKRLNRHLDARLMPFGSPDYSREELVAEMGSAFLCAAAGISPPTIEQSAAYIAGWRKKLSDDPRLIISAAGAGQRAADWILGPPPEKQPAPAVI
jgi:antirestriction protein ArdC